LYLSLAAIFVAQAAGIQLSLSQQLVLLLTLMLTSKGVAGVPRGALVILLGTVGSFGLPTEPVFMILGIDALMDMLRTSLNVLGNCLATVVIARWEGEFEAQPDRAPRDGGGPLLPPDGGRVAPRPPPSAQRRLAPQDSE
jgi:proton glutamate symport protein